MSSLIKGYWAPVGLGAAFGRKPLHPGPCISSIQGLVLMERPRFHYLAIKQPVAVRLMIVRVMRIVILIHTVRIGIRISIVIIRVITNVLTSYWHTTTRPPRKS